MRLAQRLVLNAVVVATLLIASVLIIVDWRVAQRARNEGAFPEPVARETFLRETRRDIVIAGVLVLVIAMVSAGALARPLARPLEELSDVARALAAGDLSRRPTLVGAGEVEELDDALRRLAYQLDTRIRALQSEEALLAALEDSLNEGVIAVDRHNRVVRMNPIARALFRVDDAVPFSSQYLPRHDTVRSALDTVLAGGSVQPQETQIADRTLLLTARPLSAGGAVLALLDMTPFRKLEAVRRDFVANVSHELRTPLTIIGGFVETLQGDDVPPQLQQQFLGMAAGNVRRMQRIVDDLLDLSRIESGGWVPNPVEQDVSALATEVMAPLHASAEKKRVSLRVDVGSGAATIFADYTASRQIVANLVENAIRHTTTGEISVFSRRELDGVWIGVQDTGGGIPPEHLPRVFERFYRADPGRSRAEGGTGLGLSIVKHLVEAHGGRVQASSRMGAGTTVETWFPDRSDLALSN